MRLILASASPRRRELLAALVADFEVIPSSVEETLTGDGFVDAERLAYAKATDVLRENPDAIVLGSDTLVFDNERSYGKPVDDTDAFTMWKRLGGRLHTVATGVAVVSATNNLQLTEAWDVELTPLSDDEIRAYIASGRPMDKAGAYAIQDEDVPTVSRLHGCFCSVMGLPLWTTKDLLEAAGIECRSPSDSLERCRECPSRPSR